MINDKMIFYSYTDDDGIEVFDKVYEEDLKNNKKLSDEFYLLKRVKKNFKVYNFYSEWIEAQTTFYRKK